MNKDVKAKAKAMQQFAEAEISKVDEILSSVRAIHGTSVGDRMTYMTNVLIHTSQVNMLVVGLYSQVVNSTDDMDLLMSGMSAVTSAMDKSHDLATALFYTLFSKEEYDTLLPFVKVIQQHINGVTSKVTGER